jgi:hypothetical protein
MILILLYLSDSRYRSTSQTHMVYRMILLQSQLEMEFNHDVMAASTTLTELGVCNYITLVRWFAERAHHFYP